MPENESEQKAKEAKAAKINEAIKAAGLGHQGHPGQQLDKMIEGLGSVTEAIDVLAKRHDDLAKRLDDALVSRHLPMPGGKHRGATFVPKGDGDDTRDIDAVRWGEPQHVVADSSGWLSDDRKRENIQVAYDKVACCWGEDAPRYMSGEQPIDYRRRLARRWQRFSPEFKDVDLDIICDPALAGIEQRIRADATRAANTPGRRHGRCADPAHQARSERQDDDGMVWTAAQLDAAVCWQQKARDRIPHVFSQQPRLARVGPIRA